MIKTMVGRILAAFLVLGALLSASAAMDNEIDAGFGACIIAEGYVYAQGGVPPGWPAAFVGGMEVRLWRNDGTPSVPDWVAVDNGSGAPTVALTESHNGYYRVFMPIPELGSGKPYLVRPEAFPGIFSGTFDKKGLITTDQCLSIRRDWTYDYDQF